MKLYLPFRLNFGQKSTNLQITLKSVFYNEFLSWSYVCDIFLEPIFWFIENFTSSLGSVSINKTNWKKMN